MGVQYYKVPTALDGRRVYNNGAYYELAKDELFTLHECKRYGIRKELLEKVKVKGAFWFFGRRFAI